MDLSSLYVLISTTLVLVLVLEQRASSATPRPGSEGGGPPTRLAPRAHAREKRCSCENLKDKECIYFCHIGIVWVNTPGQVVPYGVGSFPVRLRRELPGRCVCADRRDDKCLLFCSALTAHIEDANTSHARRFPTTFKKRYKARNLKTHSQLT